MENNKAIASTVKWLRYSRFDIGCSIFLENICEEAILTTINKNSVPL